MTPRTKQEKAEQDTVNKQTLQAGIAAFGKS